MCAFFPEEECPLETAIVAAQILSWATLEAVAKEVVPSAWEALLDRRSLLAEDGDELASLPLLEHFYAWLGRAASDDGRRVAEVIGRQSHGGRAPSRSPSRSLVGRAETFEVATQLDRRDRDDEGGRFSLLLVRQKKTVAYVLCRVVEEEKRTLVLRGAFVAEDARGKGLTKLLLRTFLALAKKLGFQAVRTDTIDKPLLGVALLSAGFLPDDDQGDQGDEDPKREGGFRREGLSASSSAAKKRSKKILVAPAKEEGRGACVVFPSEEDEDDAEPPSSSFSPPSSPRSSPSQQRLQKHRHLRSALSNTLCKNQRIRVADVDERPPATARVSYVNTKYHRPSHVDDSSDGVVFCAARLLAIVGRFGLPQTRGQVDA